MNNDTTELRRDSSELSIISTTHAVHQKLHRNKIFTSARASNQINNNFLRVTAVASQFSSFPCSDQHLTNTLTRNLSTNTLVHQPPWLLQACGTGNHTIIINKINEDARQSGDNEICVKRLSKRMLDRTTEKIFL